MIIGICEDNEAIREELRQEIARQQTGIMTQLYEFSSGEAMLNLSLIHICRRPERCIHSCQ